MRSSLETKEANIPSNAEEAGLSFAYFVPGIQNEILSFVGEDVSIKTVPSSYPCKVVMLFNNVQKVFPLSLCSQITMFYLVENRKN